MSRSDISKELVHWTKGESYQDAFDTLMTIVMEGRLLGGNGHIKGLYDCVCFTEAPTGTFHEVVGKYKPFGIRVSKKWLYEQGGRPVIYQSDSEYDALPEQFRWRHVRYEPTLDQPVDFTWEREWRLRAEELEIGPENSRIIVPGEEWVEELARQYNDKAYWEATDWNYELMYQPETFNWEYSVINV